MHAKRRHNHTAGLYGLGRQVSVIGKPVSVAASRAESEANSILGQLSRTAVSIGGSLDVQYGWKVDTGCLEEKLIREDHRSRRMSARRSRPGVKGDGAP
jgi:hypothetical protein